MTGGDDGLCRTSIKLLVRYVRAGHKIRADTDPLVAARKAIDSPPFLGVAAN
jgi:hypothetical protein